MSKLVVPSKYQVVIPQKGWSRLKLKPGQQVVVLDRDGIAHVIPVRPIKERRGFAGGVNTEGIRDEPDRS